jgi:hypothetical protein
MPDTMITLANGREISFAVPPEGAGPACFLLGVRKCGSSILNSICEALARLNNRGFVDVGHTFFTANVLTRDWQRDPALRNIVRQGIVYGGFRDMPLGLLEDEAFRTGPKFLLVRDPRDALVSEYFSNAYSHHIPPSSGDEDAVTATMLAKREQALAADISDYVLRMAGPMNHTMSHFKAAPTLPNIDIVKYEDLILDKARLIGLLAARFGMQVTEAETASILGWADKVPLVEDPRAFVRRVRPGDHREKLATATIARLNSVLRPAMTLFGYES